MLKIQFNKETYNCQRGLCSHKCLDEECRLGWIVSCSTYRQWW